MNNRSRARFLYGLTLAILLNTSLFAGDVGKLIGTVLDKTSEEPLMGVNVVLLGSSYGVASGEDGKFMIMNIAPGLYNVKFTYIGSGTVTIEGVRISTDLTTNLFQVHLASEAIEGQEIIVTAEKPLIEINATNEVRVIRAEDIQNMNVRGYADIIALQTGVVTDASGNLHIRGGRTDEVGFYVDGVYVNNAFTSGRAGDVPNLSLEEVSFQAGGFGAEYGSANAGIVQTTTKTGGNKLAITVEGISDFGAAAPSVKKPFSYSYGYNLGSFALGGPMPGFSALKYFLSVEKTSLDDASPTNSQTPVYTGDLNVAGQPATGENFTDSNGNTIWDIGEAYVDSDGNGVYTAQDYTKIDPTAIEYHWGPKRNNWVDKMSLAGNILLDLDKIIGLPFKLKVGGSDYSSDRSNYSHSRSLFNYYNTESTDSRVSSSGDFLNRFNQSKSTFRSYYAKLNGLIPGMDNAFFNLHYSHSSDSYESFDPVFKEGFGGYIYEDGTLMTDNTQYLPYLQFGKVTDYSGSPTYSYTVSDSNGNELASYDYDYWTFDTVDISYDTWAADTSVYWAWDSTAFWSFDEINYGDTTWINPLYRGPGQGPIGTQELAEFGVAGQASTSYEKRFTWRDSYKGSVTWQKGNNELKAGFDYAVSKIRYYRMGRASSTTYYFANNNPFSPTQDTYKYTVNEDGTIRRTQGSDGTPDYAQDQSDTWKNTDYNGDGTIDYQDYMDDYIFQAYSSGYAENIGYDITGQTEANSGNNKYREPVTSAFYIRDKIEMEDLVLNLGLRWDYIDPNNKIFNPETGGQNNIVITSDNQIAETVFAKDIDNNGTLDPDEYMYYEPTDDDATGKVHRIDAKVRSLVSPRIGLAFPITDKTVFHAQYGKYFQQPENNRMFISYVRFVQNLTQGNFTISANPDLQPQENTQYEVGFKQMITPNVSIDATVFYKQMSGYPQIRNIAARPTGYALYVNGDYGTVKGLSLSLKTRRINNLMVDANYTLQYAGGTGSSASGLYRIAWQGGNNLTYVSPLDFDQRHTGNVALDYRTGNSGFLRLFGVNMLARFGSGLPYTPVKVDTEVFGGSIAYQPVAAFNSANKPWTFNVDLKVDKGIHFGKYNMKAFVWVINLLDAQNVESIYPATGQADNDGWLGSDPGQSWVTNTAFDGTGNYADEAANLYNSKLSNPYNWGAPRQVRIGFRIDL